MNSMLGNRLPNARSACLLAARPQAAAGLPRMSLTGAAGVPVGSDDASTVHIKCALVWGWGWLLRSSAGAAGVMLCNWGGWRDALQLGWQTISHALARRPHRML